MDTLQKMRQLAEKWLDGTISEAEKQEFEAWYETQPKDSLDWTRDASEEELKLRLLASLQTRIAAEEASPRIKPARKFRPGRIAAAASIFLVMGLGTYFAFLKKGKEPAPIVQKVQPGDLTPPGRSRAAITLADGRVVPLDSLTSLSDHQVSLSKTADGRIIYVGQATETAYHTLNNPKGSPVIDIQLADGSQVWLNAGSSITYPVAFTGTDRKVSMTGEAYFEAAPSISPEGGAKRKFIVEANGVNVEVLGTHFNVNAYDDEEALRVTLLEGSVQVNHGSSSIKIKPGQQAIARSGLALSIDYSPNTDQVMAWKNGLFRFDRADIGMVMRQISRWYNVEVEYKGNVNQHFGGTISRQVNASKVFEMLEMTGGVKFEIVGNKVIVMP